jgi:hypothetical protein
LIFLDDFLHHGSGLGDKFLKFQSLILILLLPLVGVFAPIVVPHHVIWRLIELVLVAKVFSLYLLLNLVIGGADDGGLDGSRLQLVKI